MAWAARHDTAQHDTAHHVMAHLYGSATATHECLATGQLDPVLATLLQTQLIHKSLTVCSSMMHSKRQIQPDVFESLHFRSALSFW
jgi:hypothetical protein